MANIYIRLLVILAWLIFIAAWGSLIASFLSFVRAVQNYGIFDIKAFLDAGFGYYGLLSFGAASVSVIIAAKSKLKSNHKLFLFFKLTFLISVLFLTPVLISMIVFLVGH